MARFELRIPEGCQEPYVEFYVDGIDLGAQIMQSLGDDGFDDVLPCYGIDYSLSETVLGEKAHDLGGEHVILLACGCGCYMCSGVSVEVGVTESTITLSKFSTWRHGREIVAPIADIVFERQQFNEAVLELHSEIERWQPPQSSPVEPEPPGIVYEVDNLGSATITSEEPPSA